ncbi:hypothetical protein ABPG72_011800 [Tetrahymena utriculariae]
MYRKLPSDLTEPTLSGAIVSIVSTLIMLILFISEFNGYLSVEENSEMFVDVAQGGQKIRVNLDIDFPQFPCDIFSLDVQDIMGSHSVNVEGDLVKTRLSSSGSYLEKIKQNTGGDHGHGDHGHGHGHGDVSLDLERVKKAFNDREGCKISGFMLVNKVPGNFHISSHAYGNYLQRIFQDSRINTLDLSHVINHLSFGEENDLNRIKKTFQQGILQPLDNTKKIKPENLRTVGVTHQYYINVVPTTYKDLSNRKYHVYQFVANSNEMTTQHLPAVFFRYDLSPVTVQFSQTTESFLHFLVQVCAIIGGVFTVAGIIDSLVHRSVVHILKKAEIGKLS